MAFLVYFVLFLALTGHSSATYCICKDGVGDQVLQKALDYACGNGADCTQILQNGACYQPNTLKDHCNYAVNSYFQKHSQAPGSCDFAGAATASQTPPTTSSTCVYQSTPSSAGTPSSTTPGTPPSTVPNTPTGSTPGTGTSTGTGTGTGTGIGTGTGTGTGTGPTSGTTSGNPNVFGISPTSTTGSGFNDNSSAGVNRMISTNVLLLSFVLIFWLASRV